MTLSEIFNLENPAFMAYVVHCGILGLKMLLMSVFTAANRMHKGIFISPEDTALAKNSRAQVPDDKIERIRRAHLNDLENIPVFMIICALYLITDPNVTAAVNLIRVFTIVRLLHTFVYAVIVVPQPTRALLWATGYSITIYMVIMIFVKFITFI